MKPLRWVREQRMCGGDLTWDRWAWTFRHDGGPGEIVFWIEEHLPAPVFRWLDARRKAARKRRVTELLGHLDAQRVTALVERLDVQEHDGPKQ